MLSNKSNCYSKEFRSDLVFIRDEHGKTFNFSLYPDDTIKVVLSNLPKIRSLSKEQIIDLRNNFWEITNPVVVKFLDEYCGLTIESLNAILRHWDEAELRVKALRESYNKWVERCEDNFNEESQSS